MQLQTQSIVVCFLFRVGQNRLFTPYMTVTSPPKKSKFKCIILACLILLLAQSSNASAIGRQGISFQVIPLAQHPPASYFVCVQQCQRYWTAGGRLREVPKGTGGKRIKGKSDRWVWLRARARVIGEFWQE